MSQQHNAGRTSPTPCFGRPCTRGRPRPAPQSRRLHRTSAFRDFAPSVLAVSLPRPQVGPLRSGRLSSVRTWTLGSSTARANNGAAKPSPTARNRREHLRRCRHERSLLIMGEPDHGHRIFECGEALSIRAEIGVPPSRSIPRFPAWKRRCVESRQVS
jgi:hypothetical protein